MAMPLRFRESFPAPSRSAYSVLVQEIYHGVNYDPRPTRQDPIAAAVAPAPAVAVPMMQGDNDEVEMMEEIGQNDNNGSNRENNDQLDSENSVRAPD